MAPIKCSDYDYVEILCMHQYEVKLILVSGIEILGYFNTTCYVSLDDQKQEAIKGIDQHQQPLVVLLTDIVSIDVLSPNALFDYVSFAD
ncbi:Rho-binding antiterminator [Shewanella phaeophyticola]|uniref:Rho-binding antiterminator n=1 Tax=Shewanella phaeophyticola TaxID=2978345 RepID=A0ABT2P551_9GAMM|nr:Rho-binding antiterminator [Shewanella sp. KJ10-1]MCT8986810.1 Rho-binding antiterminator [Shewanella sp. KJ10-1]